MLFPGVGGESDAWRGVQEASRLGCAVFDGWSRRRVQEFLVEHTQRAVADFKRAGRLPGPVTAADETTQRRLFERPDDLLIVCAGGRAGSWSACLPGWGNKWTKAVTTRIETTGRRA